MRLMSQKTIVQNGEFTEENDSHVRGDLEVETEKLH